MKKEHATMPDLQRIRLIFDIEARIGALFTMLPELCGFSVQGAASADLQFLLTEVSVHPYGSMESAEEVGKLITAELLDLVGESSEAWDVLRGRTFARTLH